MRPTTSALLALLLCAIAWSQNGPNLIANPGADAGAGAPTGYETVVVPAWAPTGTFTAVPWSVGGGFPIVTDPGPPDRAANLFAGGSTVGVSTGSQVASVAAHAALIDAGSAGYELSGWFGGFSFQEDRAKLTASFRDGTGAPLGSATIGDVTATERGSLTGLLYRAATGVMPAGTRSIEFLLTMTRFAGTYNDGYADSLSFRLASTASVATLGSGCGGSPVAALTAGAPTLGLPWSISVTGAAPNASGQLLISAPPPSPFPIGGGCLGFIDLAAFLVLAPVSANAAGAWSLALGLPADPGLAALQIVSQAYAVPGTGPFGLDITNGLLLTLGF